MLFLCRHLSFGAARPRRLPAFALLFVALATAAGCRTSRKVAVPQLLSPLVEADTPRLLAEVNRLAAVRSLRGKVDIQFLDTSFARCGVAEKYATADGTVTVQRPGQINFVIQVPFIGTDVAQMTSDGQRFAVAVLQGDQKYRQFVRGSNAGDYARLGGTSAQADADCGGNEGKRRGAMNERAVSALSGLRPQHLTDALLIPPAAAEGSNLLYARSETFEEEDAPPPKAGEKKNGRVVRGYYLLVELAPEGERRARVTRRFWFDRVETLRLARIQTYDGAGRLTTDVVYRDARAFGEEGRYQLPAVVELTRPQDRYSLRISYQAPDSVKVDQPYQADFFDLKNTWGLPEVDLDERLRRPSATSQR